jgi:hypothetical protein
MAPEILVAYADSIGGVANPNEQNHVNGLSKRAFIGALELSSALLLLMFVPAWSLHFWQAWLYWTLFPGFVLAITLYFISHDPALIERRLAAGPRAESRASQKIIQVATILLFGLKIIPGLDHRFHWSVVPVPAVLVANALCVLAMAFIALVVPTQQLCRGHDQD